MRGNLPGLEIKELYATTLDLLLLSERRSVRDPYGYFKAKHVIPHRKLDVDSAEPLKPSLNEYFARSARRFTYVIVEKIKSAIRRIKTAQRSATVCKINVQDVPKDDLDSILRFSQSVLFRYHLKTCISYEPVRRTGSKCGVHFRAISNELQSPAHCYIRASHLKTFICYAYINEKDSSRCRRINKTVSHWSIISVWNITWIIVESYSCIIDWCYLWTVHPL